MKPDAEKFLEAEVIDLFGSAARFATTGLEWETANCFNEVPGPANPIGRTSKREVILTVRLRSALERLNPTLPPLALDAVIKELQRDVQPLEMLPLTAKSTVSSKQATVPTPTSGKVKNGSIASN